MKSKMSVVSVLLSIVFIISTGSFLFAQEQEEQGNIIAISTYKVPFAKLSEFESHWEKEVAPRVKQNEYMVSQRVCTHLWGPDWTVVVIKEYKNFAAIESAHTRDVEILKKRYPDQKKRDEIMLQFDNFLMGHDDAIVQEIPRFRK